MFVSVSQARTRFSELIRRVAIGEQIVITKSGKAVAKLVGVTERLRPTKRILGSAKGEFTLPDDFNESDPEIEALFYEEDIFPREDLPDK